MVVERRKSADIGQTLRHGYKGKYRDIDMAQDIRVHTSLPDGCAGTINMTLHCQYNCTARDVCVD